MILVRLIPDIGFQVNEDHNILPVIKDPSRPENQHEFDEIGFSADEDVDPSSFISSVDNGDKWVHTTLRAFFTTQIKVGI